MLLSSLMLLMFLLLLLSLSACCFDIAQSLRGLSLWCQECFGHFLSFAAFPALRGIGGVFGQKAS